MSLGRSKILIGVVSIACLMLMKPLAAGGARPLLGLDLAPGRPAPSGLPESLRVTMTNWSTHTVVASDLTFTLFVVDEPYVWARMPDAWTREFEIAPGERLVRVIPVASLTYDSPEGHPRTSGDVVARLTQWRWSVVASVDAEFEDDPNGPTPTVLSNELGFSPVSARTREGGRS